MFIPIEGDMLSLISIFTILMALLHLVAFVTSIITNNLASDYATSSSKVDRKSRLFRRLTVLQCQIAQFHNLWRLPLIVRLFHWNWSSTFLDEVTIFE